MRCAPQVAGAARDTAGHARTGGRPRTGSSVDNPVVTLDGRVESTGNFHGAPLGYAPDFLPSPRPRWRDQRTPGGPAPRRRPLRGLTPFLPRRSGRQLGPMIAQYTQAAIVAENQAVRRARQRRLDPVVGDAGGPRVDGLGGRPQAAPRPSTV